MDRALAVFLNDERRDAFLVGLPDRRCRLLEEARAYRRGLAILVGENYLPGICRPFLCSLTAPDPRCVHRCPAPAPSRSTAESTFRSQHRGSPTPMKLVACNPAVPIAIRISDGIGPPRRVGIDLSDGGRRATGKSTSLLLPIIAPLALTTAASRWRCGTSSSPTLS